LFRYFATHLTSMSLSFQGLNERMYTVAPNWKIHSPSLLLLPLQEIKVYVFRGFFSDEIYIRFCESGQLFCNLPQKSYRHTQLHTSWEIVLILSNPDLQF
jgi:hypothetical protein